MPKVSKRFDVIIVGAGPAGSTTAEYASRGGAKTLILEKRKKVGYPVQCGEYLPVLEDIQGILPRATGLEELFDIPSQLKEKDLPLIRVHSPRGSQFDLPFEGYTVDRLRFDPYLASKAEKAGADLITGVRVKGVRSGVVKTTAGDFHGKVIVGADGPRSTVARSVGLPAPSQISQCLCADIPGDFPAMTQMWFGKLAPGGYAWVIPKSKSANIGLGVQHNITKKPLTTLFREFRKRFDGKPNWVSGGPVPVSGPVKETVRGNVMLVGDAAGFIMASNGGGIITAMVAGREAGQVAAQHINNGTPVTEYEKRWKYLMEKELKTAVRTKWLADRFFPRDWSFEMVMRFMGPTMMKRAIMCKSIFTGR